MPKNQIDADATPTAAQLRRFAADNDIYVAPRGYVAQSVKDTFAKANKTTRRKYLAG